MARVTLLTGGNLGDRQGNLEQAALLIGRQIGPVVLSSSVYESEPWGFEAEELFLNQALVVETALTPMAVLERIHAIERSLGREREESPGPEPDRQDHQQVSTFSFSTSASGQGQPQGTPGNHANLPDGTEAAAGTGRTYHSRTIDIDILFYDNIRLNTPRLVIPHPRIGERDFVLRPLAEIIPDYIHPVTGHSIRYMWQQFCRKNAQR